MINLYINQRRAADVTILDLKGKLRIGGNAVALHRSIRSLILEKKLLIVMNLTDVTFIDSCGLGELVASQISAQNKGGEIKLVGLTDALRELLTVTKLVTVFDIYDKEADAIESFDSSLAEAGKNTLVFA